MATMWDILGKAANLVQLLGLEAFTLITIAVSFLRLREIRKECQKLEERMWMLRLLLCSPAGYSIVTQQQQQHLELGDLVSNALRDAHGLVESYNESTLFARVRRGRCMASQIRDLHSRIDYCLILAVNACLLIVANPPLPSHVRNQTNDKDVPTSDTGSTDAEKSTGAPGDSRMINVSQK